MYIQIYAHTYIHMHTHSHTQTEKCVYRERIYTHVLRERERDTVRA